MPLYIGDKKVKSLYLGQKEVLRLQVGSDIIFDSITFPTTKRLPSSYTLTTVARVDGANHTIYTAPASGFYEVAVQAGHGNNAILKREDGGRGGGYGAYRKAMIFLYAGTKCLLWSGESYKTDIGDYAKTGYPEPSDAFGGRGACYSYGSRGRGIGGGGASNNALPTEQDGDYGGGAGAGFIAGLPFEVADQTWTSSPYYDISIDINTPLTVGDFSVLSICTYILCGGGGGCLPDGTIFAAGGGGAYGNGGSNVGIPFIDKTTGPGGLWGAGDLGARGASCIMDFSWNQFNPYQPTVFENPDSIGSDGYVELKRVIEN